MNILSEWLLKGFLIVRRGLARLGLKLDFGPSKIQILQIASHLSPQPSPRPLIRVGGDTDGAYLVPDDLEGIGACFSPGVAAACSFEMELAERGVRSFMADFSVSGPPVAHSLFDFEKLFIGPRTDQGMFITLGDWVASKPIEDLDLILQMDIEGSEWAVLQSIPPEVLKKFRIIVIELHDVDEMMTSVHSLEKVGKVFEKLSSDFISVHLHANNCCPPIRFRGLEIPRVIEVTLLRKDRFLMTDDRHPAQIPHPLDIRNLANRRPVGLGDLWCGGQA